MDDPLRSVVATRRALRSVGIILAVLILLTVALAMADRSLTVFRKQWLLTCIALGLAGLFVYVAVGALRTCRWTSRLLFAAVLVSQVAFLMLVWSPWTTNELLWQVWYVSLVVSIMLLHLLLLYAAGPDRRDPAAMLASVCAVLTGVMFVVLGLREDRLAAPGAVLLWCTAIPAIGAVVGTSFVAHQWWLRLPLKGALRKYGLKVLAVVAVAFAFFGGMLVGRASVRTTHPFEIMPSALNKLAPEELDRQVRDDLVRLKATVEAMHDLDHKVQTWQADLRIRLASEGRDYYTPQEDDGIRANFQTYLTCRTSLLRLVAMYAGFESVHGSDAQARCFMLGYTAGMVVFDASAKFVDMYATRPLECRKLNEPEPAWGIPAGMFDRIRDSVTNPGNIELAEEMTAYFDVHRADWREAGFFPAEDFQYLETLIDRTVAGVRERRGKHDQSWIETLVRRVQEDAYTPVFAVQSMTAELMGDIRLVQRPPLIAVGQIEEIESKLRPGDIILERRNWFLSNAFLPGFWPHSAIYIGRPADLERLGIADDPAVRAAWHDYTKLADDGYDHTVIEAVSEGVIFNSLIHSIHADYAAVLRPRLTDEQIGEAIARAFRHYGKPYDFEFDFFTSDQLVCTELVYRSYEGLLNFNLVRIMGRNTLPALEIARKFARERSLSDRQLDFVLFLDADASSGRAGLADEAEFCASVDRPRAFNE